MKRYVSIFIVVLTVLLTYSCSDPVIPADDPVPSTIVFADGVSVSKIIGSGTYTNAVSGVGSGAISWSSGTLATATVDADTGVVTLVVPGTTVITASKAATATHSAVSNSYTLTVTAAVVTKLPVTTLIPSTIDFADNTSVSKMIGSGTYTNAVSGAGTGAISWSSGTPATATVDVDTGAVTLVAAGTTVITANKAATATHSAVSNSYTLTVTAATVTPLIPSTIVFADDTPVSRMIGSGTYTNAVSGVGAGAISWSSGTPATATVDADTGAVTLVAAGTTVITANKAATATHSAISNSYTLTVEPASLPPIDDIAYTGGFQNLITQNMSSFQYTYANFTIDTYTNDVGVFVPAGVSAKPALIVAFYGTGGEPYLTINNDYYFQQLAQTVKDFIVVAPDAYAKNVPGQANDADHFDPAVTYPTSWNTWETDPNANKDILLIRAAIDSAIKTYNADPERIYFMGHSNGGFFTYFAAMVLHERVAAFVASSGGVSRAGYNRGSTTFMSGNDTALTVSDLQSQPAYPAFGKATFAGSLFPDVLPGSGHIPHGFIYHGTLDPIVPVVFSCILADAMGNNATVRLRPRDHAVPYYNQWHDGSSYFAIQAWDDLSHWSLP